MQIRLKTIGMFSLIVLAVSCLSEPLFPSKPNIKQVYGRRNGQEINNAIDSLFTQVSDKQQMIQSIQFLIDSDAWAEYAIDEWISLILKKPGLFREAYKELNGKQRAFVDGIWEITTSEQLESLQEEFISICSFWSNVSLVDDFKYSKSNAKRIAVKALAKQSIQTDRALVNIGITSKDCDDKPLNVVFIAFPGTHEQTYVDITISFKNDSFGDVIEYSNLNKFCPRSMVDMKRKCYADSGCE